MRRRAGLLVTTGALALALAACAGYRTERQGRDVGRAICDVKKADNADQAQRALQKLDRRLDKATRVTGRPVQNDVRDIQNNLDDLVTHVRKGRSDLAHQDVTVIKRNIAEVVDNAPDLVKRFYEGVKEGLGDCT